MPVRLTTPTTTTKARHLLSRGRGIPTSSETARSCHAISVNGAACSTTNIIMVMCRSANHQPQAACLQGREPSSALAPADGSRSATSPLPQRPLCAVASSVKHLLLNKATALFPACPLCSMWEPGRREKYRATQAVRWQISTFLSRLYRVSLGDAIASWVAGLRGDMTWFSGIQSSFAQCFLVLHCFTGWTFDRSQKSEHHAPLPPRGRCQVQWLTAFPRHLH